MTFVPLALAFLSGCVFMFVLLIWLATRPKVRKRLGISQAPTRDHLKSSVTLN